jgi:hypothetical protein
MNIINKNNSIYGTLTNDAWIVDWIKTNLSTSKKFINANYTRNNFAKLKTDFPDIWNQIKGKTISYNNKSGKQYNISFADKE